MVRKIASDIFKFTAPLILVGAIFWMFDWWLNLQIEKINDNDFEFQFVGILLGFALTIFQFIVSLVDKVRERKETEFKGQQEKLKRIKDKVEALYSEIKDNIIFIFISLLMISCMYLVGDPGLYVKNAFNALRSAIFFLNLYAVYDLIVVSFKVSDTTSFFE